LKQLTGLVIWGIITRPLHDWCGSGKKSKFKDILKHKVGLNMYSLHLWAWQLYTIGEAGSLPGHLILGYTPGWNLLVKMLTSTSPGDFAGKVERYKPHKRYQWDLYYDMGDKLLSGTNVNALDKKICEYVLSKI